MRMLLAPTMLLAMLTASASAQDAKTQLPAAPMPRGPVLTGEDGKAVQGVRLSRADVKAVVHGNLAHATMTLTFANNFAAVLGGNLVFPLPEGATVTGYGLDINGQMVDGVAVEKERARIIYNSEIHKRVDPGLIEHVEGNAFRTRLYPIPANGTRSIRIEYVTQVEQSKAGPSLSLPLGFGDGLDELTIHLEAPEAAAAPTVKEGGIEGLTFARAERGFAAMASAKKAKTADQLIIMLPELAERSVAVEKRLKFPRTIEELEGCNRADDNAPAFEHYFVITDTPSVVPRQAAQLKNKRVGVVWDASLSRGDVDHARELKLLEAVLNRLGNPGVDLIILRDKVEVRPYFEPDVRGTTKLIDAIKALPYDGATALGSLILPKNLMDYGGPINIPPVNYDLFLLFTDGFGNLGSDRPLRAEVPVYAMSDEAKANYPLLRSICQESGGNYFNLNKSTDEQVLAGVGDAAFSLVSVECKADEIADVQPTVGTAITGRLMVSGKLRTPQATVTLHYGYGKEVVASQTFTINSAGAEEGTLLPRFWAQQKVAALSLLPEKNAEELTRLGRQFNLVTANTSLLVLETVEQYVQYRVVPPPTRPDVYKQFLVQIEQHRAQEAQTQEQKLQQVVALWNARVQWWEKEYKYPANLKVAPVEGKRDDGPFDGFRVPGSAPFAPPSPPAARAADDVIARRGYPAQRQRPGDPHPEPAAQPHRPEPAPAAAPPAPAVAGAARASDSRDNDQTVIQNPVGNRESGVSVRRAHRNDPQEPEIHQQVFALLGAKLGKDGKGDSDDGLAITIKPWDPKTPYLEAMKSVAPEKAYHVYLSQRKAYATSPAFYLDCADYLVKSGQRDLGVRVLTDIVELELHDARLLRVAAHRLNQIGERPLAIGQIGPRELAIDLFEKVLKLRPEEPQSYRDLALALADRADAAMAMALIAADSALPPQQTVDAAISDYMRSLELLNKVVLGNWPRFPEVELPVLMEANAISAKAQRLPRVHDFRNPIDSRLQKNLDLDVRVVMTWDADQTDIDLWVTEPSGEKCFYGHNRTIIGGLLSHDFTDGYGPEEYCLRKLMPGKYAIQANYYGSRQQELTGPATVQATVITNFGRPNEKRQALTLRLKDMKEIVDVGTVTLGGAEGAKAEPAKPAPK